MAETTPSASDVLSNLDNYDFSGVGLSFLDNIDPFDPAVRPNLSQSDLSSYPTTPTSDALSSPVSATESLPDSAPRRTSRIWQHYSYDPDVVIRDAKGEKIWKCKYCKKTYKERGGTVNALLHLQKSHKITENTSHQERIGGYQSSIQESMARVAAQNLQFKRRKLDNTLYASPLDPAVLEDLYVKWLTACGVPFQMAAQPEFRA